MKRVHYIALVLLILLGCVLYLYFDPVSARLLIPLLLAGGLASVVQALIEKENVLALPKQVDDGHYNLGFVADLLIGMVGAFASLIIGIGVLNERFFQEQTNSAGNVVSQIPFWARIASFGALTGYASRKLLPDLSNKISGMVSGALNKEVAKQTQNRAALDQLQADRISMLTQAVKGNGVASIQAQRDLPRETGENTAEPPSPVEGLKELVRQYSAINIPDYGERVARKGQLADQMCARALQLHVTSSDLVDRIRAETVNSPEIEGWVLALVSLIAIGAVPGDGERLLQVANRARQKYVMYRILLALDTLYSKNFLDDEERAIAVTYLNQCLKDGDQPIKRVAEALLARFTAV